MNKIQYDDVYVEWLESAVFIKFDNYEDEESYARALNRIHN